MSSSGFHLASPWRELDECESFLSDDCRKVPFAASPALLPFAAALDLLPLILICGCLLLFLAMTDGRAAAAAPPTVDRLRLLACPEFSTSCSFVSRAPIRERSDSLSSVQIMPARSSTGAFLAAPPAGAVEGRGRTLTLSSGEDLN
eukprot:748669-Hanusia_phi.AAC.4